MLNYIYSNLSKIIILQIVKSKINFKGIIYEKNVKIKPFHTNLFTIALFVAKMRKCMLFRLTNGAQCGTIKYNILSEV